jgi:hypothetical protein
MSKSLKIALTKSPSIYSCLNDVGLLAWFVKLVLCNSGNFTVILREEVTFLISTQLDSSISVIERKVIRQNS